MVYEPNIYEQHVESNFAHIYDYLQLYKFDFHLCILSKMAKNKLSRFSKFHPKDDHLFLLLD